MLRSSGFAITAQPEDEVYLCRWQPVSIPPDGPHCVYPARSPARGWVRLSTVFRLWASRWRKLKLLEQRDLVSALAWFDVAEGRGEDCDHCAGGRWYAYMLSGEFEDAWRESD